jgi:uncharacterized membrane protein
LLAPKGPIALRALVSHRRHHLRFIVALAAGAAVWAAIGQLGGSLQAQARILAAGDAFFAVYLVSTWITWRGATASRVMREVESSDEGIVLIGLITAAAFGLCLGSLFLLIRTDMHLPIWQTALAIASVPLGWLMLHTVMALHYARLFYGRPEPGSATGGLQFPGTGEPELSDFVYYSFVVGMTAQVSDVQVLTSRLRRVTLVHGAASFFFNTVILALAVNIAVGLGQR